MRIILSRSINLISLSTNLYIFLYILYCCNFHKNGEDIKGTLQVLISCVIKCIVFILLTSPTHLCFVYIILAIYIKPLILVLGNSKQFWLVGKKTQNINFDISSWPWKLTRSLKSNADRDKLPQTSAHGTYLSYFQRVDIIQRRPYIYINTMGRKRRIKK